MRTSQAPLSAAQRDLVQALALALLHHLHLPFLNAMTPCTLRRLVYLASFGHPAAQGVLLSFAQGSDMHGSPDIVSAEVDAVIAELISSGLARRGEHTDLEITEAGRAQAPSDPEFATLARRISHLTCGYEGPYGSRLLALARFQQEALAQLENLEPGIASDHWREMRDRISEIRAA